MASGNHGRFISIPPSKSLAPTAIDWIKVKEFATAAQALAFVRKEKCWAVLGKNDTNEGVKVRYRCNEVRKRGKQCPASIRLVYHSDRESVSLYRNNQQHVHGDDPNSRGLPANVRRVVESLYNEGITSVGDILSTLRRQRLPEPPKIQLHNYIQVYKRRPRTDALFQSGTMEDPAATAVMLGDEGEGMSTDQSDVESDDDDDDDEGNVAAGQIQSAYPSQMTPGRLRSPVVAFNTQTRLRSSAAVRNYSTALPVQQHAIGTGHPPATPVVPATPSTAQNTVQHDSLDSLKRSVLLLKKQALEKDIKANEKKEAAIEKFNAAMGEFRQYIAEQRRFIAEQRLVARGADINQIPIDIPPGMDTVGLL